MTYEKFRKDYHQLRDFFLKTRNSSVKKLIIEDIRKKKFLEQAAKNEDFPLLEFIISIDEMAIQSISLKNSKLIARIFTEKYEFFKTMISKGLNLDFVDYEGFSVLHKVILSRKSDSLVPKLLNYDVNVNVILPTGFFPLHSAIYLRSMIVLKGLLAKGADINAVEKNDGRTALHSAVECNNREIVDLLLGKGASMDIYNKVGLTAFHLACKMGLDRVAEIFLMHSVNIMQSKRGLLPVFDKYYEGCSSGMAGVISEIGKIHKENLKIKSQLIDFAGGITGLHLASQYGHKNVVELILLAGGDVNVRADYGATPLSLATLGGHVSVVKFLVKKGANLREVIEDLGISHFYKLKNYSLSLGAALLENIDSINKENIEYINFLTLLYKKVLANPDSRYAEIITKAYLDSCSHFPPDIPVFLLRDGEVVSQVSEKEKSIFSR